ncbi:mycothiol transferase [Amycolatopsis sp. NBC_01480]|uniref:mycothiol transferase n=1 Tax=Amycolatopsis sp. NBC_01480 TaxID=2903562 RepID=UPI002E29AD2B|nr:DUF664 domain-containing protein [Amycolatopsis sp. NBC_01480]
MTTGHRLPPSATGPGSCADTGPSAGSPSQAPRARRRIRRARTDAEASTVAWPDFHGPARTAGETVLHVVETATHAGHVDIVREAIDGHQHLVLD